MGKNDETKSERIELQRGKILELGYSIEALEDEIEHLREIVSQKHSRIVELIGENDRLTLTYEPYHPPGSELENTGYYDLIEENTTLAKKVLDQTMVVRELEATAWEYKCESTHYQQALNQTKAKKVRTKHSGILSFDFWPLTDWLRLKLYRWNPGKAFQACVGPLRIDWFQD